MRERLTKAWMFMGMAEMAAMRSTCMRNAVGAVITDLAGTSVLSIGYNGNARRLPNTCDSDVPGECGCIHAEVNALIKAPFHQGPLTMYTTMSPCVDCAKLIINSAVTSVAFKDLYRDQSGLYILRRGGLLTFKLDPEVKSEQLELTT